MVGTDLLTTTYSELLVATLFVVSGTIVVGITIGEFSAILSAITARDRAQNEELDIISIVMLNLRLPEDIQSRVLQYYDELTKANFIITECQLYSLLSPHLSNVIKLFQIHDTLKKVSFIQIDSVREVESFATKCSVNYFLAGEIILKQGGFNDQLFIIIEGLAEVINEKRDFIFFDYKEVEKYIANTVDLTAIENEIKLREIEEKERREHDSKSHQPCFLRLSHYYFGVFNGYSLNFWFEFETAEITQLDSE